MRMASMATKVEKTYTYTCDICGQVKDSGELRRVNIENTENDYCRTCITTPLGDLLTTLGIKDWRVMEGQPA
jgi:predicted SprT family Zn-dependent metalloprotease